MASKLKKAKIKSSGQEVTVYKLKRLDMYCNAEDCRTEYKSDQLIFIH